MKQPKTIKIDSSEKCGVVSEAEHIKALLGDAVDSVNALQDRNTALAHALVRVWSHYNDTEGASLPAPIADHVAGLLASIGKEAARG